MKEITILGPLIAFKWHALCINVRQRWRAEFLMKFPERLATQMLPN